MDWYPWYPTLFKADTLDLTLEQDGAYRRLIDHYMETRMPLPEDDISLARIIGIEPGKWSAIAQQVLSKCTLKAGEYHIKRCDIELDRQDRLSKKRSDVAKTASKKRHKTNTQPAIAQQKPGNSSDTRQDKTEQDIEVSKKDICAKAVNLWNEMAERVWGKRTVQNLNATRRAQLLRRLGDCDGLDGWVAALEKVEASTDLRNGYADGWKGATFDFLLQESSFTKLMEGNYDTREDSGDALSQAFDELEARLGHE